MRAILFFKVKRSGHGAWTSAREWERRGPTLGRCALAHGPGGQANYMKTNVQDWSPRMSFNLKGSQISVLQFNWRTGSNPRCRFRNTNWGTKLIVNLCMNYVVHVSSTMWRIKNQPSNSTSCSDNALHSLVLVAGILYWGLHVMSSFSSWRCILKGYFEREVYFEGPNCI